MRLAADDRIVRLLERVPQVAVPDPVSDPLMFTGIAVLQPGFIARVPPHGEQCIIRTAYRQLFDQGEGLFGFCTDAYWWEHSTEERYLQGVFNVLEGRAHLTHAPAPVTGVHPSADIDPTAQVIAPVWIGPRVVVGPRARIGPGVAIESDAVVRAEAQLERVVVWPGAALEGTHVKAVIRA
jgi:NDP-sugar pyrophosphorylase family protein